MHHAPDPEGLGLALVCCNALAALAARVDLVFAASNT